MGFWDWLTGGSSDLGSIEIGARDPHRRRELEHAREQMSLEAHETDIAAARAAEHHRLVIEDRQRRMDEINRRHALEQGTASGKISKHRRA